MIRKTNAQAVARVLRRAGYKPASTGDSTSRWVALRCARSGDEVRVRVWSNVEAETPSQEDRETAAAIAELLAGLGYKIRYETGNYSLYVEGKEI